MKTEGMCLTCIQSRRDLQVSIRREAAKIGTCGKAVACAAGHLVAVQAEADRASFPPSKLLVSETELVEARMLSR